MWRKYDLSVDDHILTTNRGSHRIDDIDQLRKDKVELKSGLWKVLIVGGIGTTALGVYLLNNLHSSSLPDFTDFKLVIVLFLVGFLLVAAGWEKMNRPPSLIVQVWAEKGAERVFLTELANLDIADEFIAAFYDAKHGKIEED